MSSEVSVEMRGRAFIICRDYLHGAWKKIGDQDMTIKHISGGLSNHLYYCALPSSIVPVANEPAEVLVRFYGEVHGESALESLLAESVIFTLLSERRLGPRLYGVFPGGRLEQYIPARSLTTAELTNPQISRIIATKMARMHALNVPISKEPTWIWNCMKRWLKSSNEFLRTSISSPRLSSLSSLETSSKLEKLRQYNYEDELSYLRRLVKGAQSPVLFCHNDMQEGNILLNNSALKLPDKISLIDFEYCSYNYRGFDLANHFCEWTYNYKLTETPFFTSDNTAFPNRQQMLNFIRSYLHTYESEREKHMETSLSGTNFASIYSPKHHSNSDIDAEDLELLLSSGSSSHTGEEKLLQEVRVFTLASHLFWALWAIVMGHVSKIPFGYLEYALVRMEHYSESKRNLRGSNDILVRKPDQTSDQ